MTRMTKALLEQAAHGAVREAALLPDPVAVHATAKEEADALTEDSAELLQALQRKKGWADLPDLTKNMHGRRREDDWETAADDLKKQGKAIVRKSNGRVQLRFIGQDKDRLNPTRLRAMSKDLKAVPSIVRR
jgi:hypothetical protein